MSWLGQCTLDTFPASLPFCSSFNLPDADLSAQMKWNGYSQNEMSLRRIGANKFAILCRFDSDHLIPNSIGEERKASHTRKREKRKAHLSLVHKPVTIRIWLGSSFLSDLLYFHCHIWMHTAYNDTLKCLCDVNPNDAIMQLAFHLSFIRSLLSLAWLAIKCVLFRFKIYLYVGFCSILWQTFA